MEPRRNHNLPYWRPPHECGASLSGSSGYFNLKRGANVAVCEANWTAESLPGHLSCDQPVVPGEVDCEGCSATLSEIPTRGERTCSVRRVRPAVQARTELR